jgi:beta-lactamase class D
MLVEKTEKGALYGKTGSGMDAYDNWNLGWFVGFLESGDTTYVFACNLTGREKPSGASAKKIVQDVFKSQAVL